MGPIYPVGRVAVHPVFDKATVARANGILRGPAGSLRYSPAHIMNSNLERPEGSNPYSTPRSGVDRSPGADVPLASLWQRLGGSLVDGILMWLCLLGPALAAGNLSGLLEGLQTEEPEQVGQALMQAEYIATPILVLILAIFNLVLLYRDGQTIGKRLMGSRIVRTSGERASFFRIIGMRAWVPGMLYMVPVLGTVIMVLGHLTIFLKPRRCFHDYVADTKVVRD